MLGLSRREARRRFDEIIAFAELEEFLDLKLKNYSSGMSVRLAFSVAVQVDADVLLVDEVLAVGDAAFQQKCFDQFHRLKAAGKTIIFVTHDMGAVERFCDRAMLLERGAIHCARRAARDRARVQRAELRPAGARRRGEGTLRRPGGVRDRGRVVRDAAASGSRRSQQGEPLDDRDARALPRGDRGADLRVALRNEVGHTVFSTSTPVARRARPAASQPGRSPRSASPLETWFAPSHYKLTPVGRPRRRRRQRARPARGPGVARSSTARRHTGGIVDVPHAVEVAAAVSTASTVTLHTPSRASSSSRVAEPHLDARGHRLEAALLRLGARLPVDARPAVRVLRRHLRRVHGDRERRRRRQELRRSTSCSRSCCSASSPR